MFEMTIERFMKVSENIVSISGPCKNKWDFKNRLIDDSGNEYDVYMPLGKDIVIDDSNIMLCVEGEVDTAALKGRILKAYQPQDN